jgi:pimeloyl-ACP methyl ester carboxylesterase
LSPPEPRFARLSEVRLRYWDWGGDGQPLLLVHATGFHGRVWDPLARRLSPRRRVIAVDQRGHGDSDKPESDYDWHNFAADVAELADVLDIRGAAAMGHSGGAAAIAYAQAEDPGLFSGLVLIEPITYPGPRRPVVPRDGAPDLPSISRQRREVWESRDELWESWSSRPPFADWDPEALRAYIEWGFADRADGRVELKCPREYEARMFEQSFSLNAFERLPELIVPGMLIFGANTDTFTPALRDDIAERLPRFRRVDVEDAGHFVVMQRPERLAELIGDFLEQPD